MEIPKFESNGNLPPGIHLASWQEVEKSLAFNERRRELLAGLKRICAVLKLAGCQRIYIGGSFATSKAYPGDFDVCFDDQGVDLLIKLERLEPLVWDTRNKRAAQKAKYGGEFFPANAIADHLGTTYLEFFQKDKHDKSPKGIVAVAL